MSDRGVETSAGAPGGEASADSERAVGRQLRGSTLLLAGRMLSKLVNFGVQVAIVRLLSKEDFGVFAYGLALVLSGELVVKFGLGRGANRFVPYHAERGEHGEVMGTLALVCGTIVTLGALGFAGLWWVAGLGLGGFPTGEGARIVLILSLLAPIGALDTIGIQLLACFSRPRDILMRKHVLGPGLRAAAVALAYGLGGQGETLALAYLAGGAIGLVICVQLAWRALRERGILPLPMSHWRVPWRPLLRFSLPLISSDLVFITLTGVTTIVLMQSHGETGVAAMRAVVPAAQLNGLVVQSFSMLFMPVAMRLHARGDEAGLHVHHWQSAAWVAVLSFPIFGLTFGVAPALVPVLFGEAYAESAGLLAILSVGHYVSVCLAFNGETLQVFERTRAIVATDLATIVTGLVLALLLCPSLGPLGAAIAVTAARLIGSGLRQVVMLRGLGFVRAPRSQRRIWLKLILASAVAAGLGWAWAPALWIQLGLLALLSLAVLRSTAPTLDLARSFPELRRLPLFARLVGV